MGANRGGGVGGLRAGRDAEQTQYKMPLQQMHPQVLSQTMYQSNGFSKVISPTSPSTYCLLFLVINYVDGFVEELILEKPFK